MMKLYIQIVDGATFQHPMLESNLLEAFPGINLEDEASGFAKFVRIEPPVLGPYEKNQTVTYEMVDGVYTDVFKCEQLTPEEKVAKQNDVKQAFSQNPDYFEDDTFVSKLQDPNARGCELGKWFFGDSIDIFLKTTQMMLNNPEVPSSSDNYSMNV